MALQSRSEISATTLEAVEVVEVTFEAIGHCEDIEMDRPMRFEPESGMVYTPWRRTSKSEENPDNKYKDRWSNYGTSRHDYRYGNYSSQQSSEVGRNWNKSVPTIKVSSSGMNQVGRIRNEQVRRHNKKSTVAAPNIYKKWKLPNDSDGEIMSNITSTFPLRKSQRSSPDLANLMRPSHPFPSVRSPVKLTRSSSEVTQQVPNKAPRTSLDAVRSWWINGENR